MLDTININEGKVIEMYRNGEKIWEMPNVMYDFKQPMSGQNMIVCTTYPRRCDVEVKVNEKVEYSGSSGVSGIITILLKKPLESDDYVAIRMAKTGWRESFVNFIVY